MVMQAGGGITRIVDLTLTLTGISEQADEIRRLTRLANTAMTTLTMLYMMYRMVLLGMGPAGWIMLGAGVLAQAAAVVSEFTEPEEVISRGK